MTAREWMVKHYPEEVDEAYIGGVAYCPQDYGLLPEKCSGLANCRECWDREIDDSKAKEEA